VMNRRKLISMCGLAIATGAALGAQGTVTLVPRRQQGVTFAEPWRPNGRGTATKIIGTVIDIRQVPVAKARLQVRNLTNGSVMQETEANENGEYEFELADPGTYVVEMLMVDGYVVALSNAGSIGRFETMNTVIQLPGRWDSNRNVVVVSQSVTNFVGMSAQTTMTNTTLQNAVDANVPPSDPGVPASP
jgi:hypothetical protein